MTLGLGIGLGITVGGSGGGGGGVPADFTVSLSKANDGSVGQLWTATPSGVDSYTYQWSAGGVSISGATSQTYTATSAESAKYLSCTVTKTGMQSVTKSASDSLAYLGRVLDAPLLLASFDDLTNTTTSNGTQSNNTSRKVQGTGSIELVQTGTSSPQATKTGAFTGDPTTLGVIAICTDLGDDPEYVTASQIGVNMRKSTTDYTQASITSRSANNATLGQKWQSYHYTEVPALVSAGSGTFDIKTQLSSGAPYGIAVRYDAPMARAAGRPTVIFTADDGRPGYKTNAVPVLEAAGFRATFYMPTALAGQANRFIVAELQQLDAAGHDIALDGTNDDTLMTAQPNLAGLITQYQAQQAWLASNGISSRGKDHFCYPNGSTRTTGTIVQKASVTSTGTAVVTMADTSSVVAGMKVAGYQVPRSPETTVVSVDSGTQLTLSANIPSQTVAMSFTDKSGEFYTGKLQAALAAIGVKSGRQTNTGTSYTRFLGGSRNALLMPGNATSGQTLATLTAVVDQAILRGETLIFYSHDVYPGATPIDTDLTLFTDLVAYCKTKSDANLLDVLTVSQWWSRDGNSGVPV